MLILQKHHKLDSIDSEGCLNICYHQHTLENCNNSFNNKFAYLIYFKCSVDLNYHVHKQGAGINLKGFQADINFGKLF